MPELPEVQTTVNGINQKVLGRKIISVWTSYSSAYYKGKDEIKNPKFFKEFVERVVGKTIIRAERRAKNILIHAGGGEKGAEEIILIHMKMTGHVMYGKYALNAKKVRAKNIDPWEATEDGPLKDPFNRFIRLVFTFDNGRHLVLSDMRRFAKVTLIKHDHLPHSKHVKDIGPEPLESDFTFKIFSERLALRPKGKIKTVLMMPEIVAGIGNIYSDEILWRAGVHPESIFAAIPIKNKKLIFDAIKSTLKKGIDFGGDSMSDYRNIMGERGRFQDEHQAYRKTKSKCSKAGCRGTIIRKAVGGRNAHFCDTHQKLFT